MTIHCTELARMQGPGFRVHVREIANDNPPAIRPRWKAQGDTLSFHLRGGGDLRLRNLHDAGAFEAAGPIVFFPDATRWEAERPAALRRCVSLYLNGETLPLDTTQRARLHSFDDATCIQMMTALSTEVSAPRVDSAAIVSTLARLLRERLRLLLRPARQAVGAGELAQLIEANGFSLSVTEIARHYGISRRQLLRHARQSTGMSICQFIRQRRLEKAKHLLGASGDSLKRIAFDAGYSCPSEFSTQFRAATGLTPSEFRKTARG